MTKKVCGKRLEGLPEHDANAAIPSQTLAASMVRESPLLIYLVTPCRITRTNSFLKNLVHRQRAMISQRHEGILSRLVCSCLALVLVSPNQVHGEAGCFVVEIVMDQRTSLSEPVDPQPSAEREPTSSAHPRGKMKPVKQAPAKLTDAGKQELEDMK